MSLLHYLDFEPSLADEGWTVIEAGGTATRSAAAAFPERGSYGVRIDGDAYLFRDFSETIGPGETLTVGFWHKYETLPSVDWKCQLRIYNSVLATTFIGYPRSGGPISWYAFDDSGSLSGYTSTPAASQWTYYRVLIRRATTDIASDGECNLYIDGVLVKTWSNIDNYDKVDSLGRLRFYSNNSAYVGDFDEIKIGASLADVEPFSPTPASEYPEAARTLVLYRQASSDSRELADYCVSELSIPRSHLVPLPNATATESLASYATFQTEVEDDLNAWLAARPAIAAKVSTIIIGYGVPGYFTDGGVVHSSASRLMRLGSAFSSKTANPLYNPATPGRLTKTAMGGLYLTARIDADTLANAKALIDRATTVSALSALPDTDKIYLSDATYRASLNAQHLRLALTTTQYAITYNAAFVVGDLTSLSGQVSSGSRVALVDYGKTIADTLRSPNDSDVSYAVLGNGSASAVGWSNFTDIDFDEDTFFEALRVGATFAEAVIQSVKYLDYTALPVGDPLMTVAFATTGHNVYRGTPDLAAVDFGNPVAYLRAGAGSAILTDIGHAPDTRYAYVIRPVLNGLEGQDISCAAEFVTDGDGDWLGDRPSPPEFLDVSPCADGNITVRWGYRTPYGRQTPYDFALYYAATAEISAGNPAAIETYGSDGEYSHTFALSGGQSYYFTVSARSASGVESQLASVVGPILADSAAPQTPVVYTSVTLP